MFPPNGLSAIASGIAASLVSVCVCLAQESAKHPVPDKPPSQGHQQAGNENPQKFALPVRILEQPEESAGAKREQQEATQRSIDDLAAQQGVDQSTKKLVLLTVAQTALAFFGTVALLYSLLLNRKATNAAVEASAAAREALGSDRAWFVLDAFDIADIGNSTFYGQFIKEGMGLSVQWKNVGRSPAISAFSRVTSKLVTSPQTPLPAFSLQTPSETEMTGAGIIGPDSKCGPDMCVLNDGETAQFKGHTAQYLIHSKIWYYDVFHPGKMRHTEITFGCVYNGMVQTKDGPKHHISFSPVGPQNTIS